MALNFSHRPIFPGHLSEDSLVDPMRISNGGYLADAIPESNVNAFGLPWHLRREVGDCFNHKRERCDRSGYQESVSKDILDLLPSDPFGMDISSTVTAITGWLEDLEAGYGGYGSNEVGVGSGDYQLFEGLNFIWNNAMRFQAFQGNMSFNYQPNAAGFHGECSAMKGVGNAPCHVPDVCCSIGFGSACNMEDVNSGCSYEDKQISACSLESVTSGYLSEEKGVRDVSCPLGFESACNMDCMTTGCCLEGNGVVDVSCPVGFEAPCGMEEISDGYCGCSKEMVMKDGPCSTSFGTASNIEEHEGISDVIYPVVLGSANNTEDISRRCSEEKVVGDAPCSVGFVEDIMRYGNDRTDVIETSLGEAPHLVLGLAIGYLGIRDLLSVESVCKYTRAMVKSEPYLWTRIHIDPPLNERITDDLLLQLTDKAQGELQCLCLVECTRITDDGLKRVLESNPKLTKLSVPGCSKLTIEGIVNNLKAFKSMGAPGVKRLKIGALYGVENHFDELKLLLGIDSNVEKNIHKPHFYHIRHFYLSCDDDDDRALDIEMCPKCERLRLIYDCTAESCQRKEQSQSQSQYPQVCRACTLCIERCFKCGRCIIDGEYEETFCLDWLCSFCKRREDLSKSCPPSTPRID